MNFFGLGPGAEDARFFGRNRARKPLRHLAAAGIGRAEKEDAVCLFIGDRARKGDADCRSLLRLAFNFQLSAMGLDDVFDDRQTKSGTSEFA